MNHNMLMLFLVGMIMLMNFGHSQSQAPKIWQKFYETIQQTPIEQRNTLVKTFIHANTGAIPVVENDTVVFLYVGSEEQVSIAGDFSGWGTKINMTKIEGTELWFYTRSFALDARFEYKIIAGEQWILDPLNPRKAAGGYGFNSDFRMPEYRSPAWLQEPAPASCGVLQTFKLESKFLNNIRRLQVYLPANYNKDQSYPLLIVHDGNDYIEFANMVQLLDLMIAKKQIPPIIVGFIDPVHRYEEYECSESYYFFTCYELIPFLEKNFSISSNHKERGFAGASMGGLISLYLAYQMHDTCGLALCQSSAFFFDPTHNERVSKLMQSWNYVSLQNSKLWLDCGNIGDLEQLLLKGNRCLIQKLETIAVPHEYHEVNEGHNWLNWQKRLEPALIYLFKK